MESVRLTLEYDGAGFKGWAAQRGLRTVRGTLSAAIEAVFGAPLEVSVAGRTDAGVHAWAQVASIAPPELPAGDLKARLNALLPADLGVVDAAVLESGFDARRDARSRTYCYRVLERAGVSPLERGRALLCPYRLDLGELQACARALVGVHDFTAFTPTQTEHVRFQRHVLAASWQRPASPAVPDPLPGPDQGNEGALLEFWIEADSFMRNMVRALVGTMLEVAIGKRTAADFQQLLAGAPRERAGETAAPQGLYLASVAYEGWRSGPSPPKSGEVRTRGRR